jgi:ABC-2 type transport system ATP-binding protein
LMLETRGELKEFVQAVDAMGCECAVTSDHRLKIILQGGTEIRDLYRLAADSKIQIRRLAYKRDSLEDIFLKAMENGSDAGQIRPLN